MNKNEVYKMDIETWGAEAQIIMMFEEMSELQKELCKYARGKSNVDHIAEEIADVQIMLEQMMILHKCGERTDEYKEKKIDRLKTKLGIYD